MKPEDFEKKLSQTPLRPAPEAWRAEILRQAEAALGTQPALTPARHESSLRFWWQELLWPNPKAWTGVAAAWCVIIILNHTDAGSNTAQAKVESPVAGPTAMAWLQQHQSQLNFWQEPERFIAPMEPPKPSAPKRRSELRITPEQVVV